MRNYYVYILANRKGGALYIGVTSNLVKRVYEHRTHAADSHTSQYDITSLVWYECATDVLSAIAREKQLKNWKRRWKIELVEKENPEWKDLYSFACGAGP
ncbi:MAG: GIY-YIG nuclease family protein [Patescibacteria group bacterium]